MNGKLFQNFSLIFFLITNSFFSTNVFAEETGVKNILIVHPFTPEHPLHIEYNAGIKNHLEKNEKYQFNYFFEYLDLARHSHEEGYIENIASYLSLKYKNHQPDFVITQGNIVDLFGRYGEAIFPNTPKIVAWNRERLPEELKDNSNYFFMIMPTDAQKNIELILKTSPKTKKIYIVIGDSVDERNFVSSLLNSIKPYKSRIEFVFLNKLPYQGMLKVLENTEENSAILYFRYLADIEGNSFIPEEVIQTVANVAKVPVYGTAMQFIGSGVVGGFVRDQHLAGEKAANTILHLIDKTMPQEQLVSREVSNIYAFDWRQLKRWDIKEQLLPEKSQIKFREISLFEQYLGYILGGFGLIILQTLLIFGLLINKRKREKAEKELLKSNNSLQSLTERLIKLNKTKDEFLTTTSHELQTPLNGIINITETILEERFGTINQKQKDELQIIHAIAKRLSLLVRDIIDLEKINRDELQLNFTAVNVKSAAVVVSEVLRYVAQSKQVEISINVSNDISPVYVDENRLIQVLYNLLGNSVKFTPRGTVTLIASEENDFVKISVEDNGIGMASDYHSKLFHEFTFGNDEIPSQYGGSGLGLYITKKLLERMNGEIFIEWSEIGKGTCISFKLPKADKNVISLNESAASIEINEIKVPDERNNKNFKILAVDDEPTNLRVLKTILTGEGYEVLTVTNGRDAIKLIHNSQDIDLVLMDVMMPEMSGFEACRIIRENYSLYELPIFILTARNTQEDIVTGFEAGANDFLVKPFVAKELKARVATILLMKKKVLEALRNEVAFLQAQIKPHFLYNALSTIISFCYTDGERAGKLLGELSEYLRRSFDIDRTTTTVTLKNELELTQAYVEIEKARFGDRLHVDFDIDKQLLEKKILPLTIQPLVENAIRHGVMKRKSGGHVKIIVKKENDFIFVSVKDNGVGIENVEQLFEENRFSLIDKRNGVGLINIKQRLMKYFQTDLLIDSTVNDGMKVTFKVPIKN